MKRESHTNNQKQLKCCRIINAIFFSFNPPFPIFLTGLLRKAGNKILSAALEVTLGCHRSEPIILFVFLSWLGWMWEECQSAKRVSCLGAYSGSQQPCSLSILFDVYSASSPSFFIFSPPTMVLLLYILIGNWGDFPSLRSLPLDRSLHGKLIIPHSAYNIYFWTVAYTEETHYIKDILCILAAYCSWLNGRPDLFTNAISPLFSLASFWGCFSDQRSFSFPGIIVDSIIPLNAFLLP